MVLPSGAQSPLRRLDPHVVVVERRASVGRALDGAGERIDARASLELIIGGDALNDDDASLHTGKGLRRRLDLAPLVGIASNEELTYSRAGLVTSRKGWRTSAISITSQWSRTLGMAWKPAK